MRRMIVLVIVALFAFGACANGDEETAPGSPEPVDTAAPAETSEPTTEPVPDEGVDAFVAAFMQLRLDGDRDAASAVLTEEATTQYGSGDLELVAPEGETWTRFEVLSSEQADANSYEVQVRVYLEDGSTFTETMFVGVGTTASGEQRTFAVRGAVRG